MFHLLIHIIFRKFITLVQVCLFIMNVITTTSITAIVIIDTSVLGNVIVIHLRQRLTPAVWIMWG